MAHAPTHKRVTSHVDADGRPQVSVLLVLVGIVAVVALLLATSMVSERLVG
ncbi:MAG TPA: hypothetical protein PLZ93_23125 [Nocardioides sp.]|uniref:hypothetical protein n=1 Tax=uncultured Nocardioides sp. TaxID=198441 RepID=UPI00261036A9|nr:hypothetical protein [uncultured Nocardioides sp.]HRD63629.1 hypothetical protein [Nocardioides sp.]HRI98538.1 hypothetical protein [Nocardioides sp.]HRK48176.1 hypothetical protein [Nocardioides sp.]